MKRFSETADDRLWKKARVDEILFWKEAKLEEIRRYERNMVMKEKNLREIAVEMDFIDNWTNVFHNQYDKMYKAPYELQGLYIQYLIRHSELSNAEHAHLMDEHYYYSIPPRLPINV